MKLSRERKLYASILGLAACGLLVDRLFLGASLGPAPASAATESQPSPAAAPPKAQPPAAPSVSVSDQLRQGVQRLDRDAAVNADVLAVPEAWIQEIRAQAAARAKEAPAPAAAPAPIKLEARLRAVMSAAGGGAGPNVLEAVIELPAAPNTLARPTYRLRVGQEFQGFTVSDITPRSVVFERDGQREEITFGKN